MADKTAPPDVQSDASAAPPTPPKRGPGHRGAEVKDTVAEMAAKAHEISLEAGSRMAAAMKDVINAAAGLSGFVLESARDLVQYMVRRGQMTQEEADKLIRQAEDAQANRPKVAPPKATAAASSAPASPLVVEEEAALAAKPAKPAAKKAAAKAPAKAKAEGEADVAENEEPEEDSSDELDEDGEKSAAKKAAAKTSAAKKSSAKKK